MAGLRLPVPSPPIRQGAPDNEQYSRKFTLVISTNKAAAKDSFNGLDLSALRCKFSVKKSNVQTPNTADIRVYNVEADTAALIKKDYKLVILQAGYEDNYGVIFKGNIKQVIIGRESATDTFIDLVCGDGDLAYNFAIVNTSLAAGSSPADQVNAAISQMSPKGVTLGSLGTLPQNRLPRGKVMYGNARNYNRAVAQNSKQDWSIQDGQAVFIPLKSYRKGEVPVLTSKSGMIGTPQQTNEGVNVKCLINPKIQVGGRVKIDNKSVADFKINLSVVNSPANIAPPLNADGVYFVLVTEYEGDNRGIPWYINLVCLNTDATIPVDLLNSVQTNYGP